MMPEMDGFGVLERLRADGRINDLPVVVISALNEIDPVVRCVELGAEDFIFKPFNPTLLRARVLASLEKKALRDHTREELRRKQAELAEARTLQLSLVPPPFRGTIGGLDVAVDVLLEPAKEVGGDLVDHFRIGDDLLVLALGDVSDKGAGAALVMARTHSLIRGLAARPDAHDVFSAPEHALRLVNAALAPRTTPADMFVTFLLATADLARRRLTYVRAGHVPPFRHRAGGTVERLGTLGGLPLGMMEGIAYRPEVGRARGGRPPADPHRRVHRSPRPSRRAVRRAAHRGAAGGGPRGGRCDAVSRQARRRGARVRGRTAGLRRHGGDPVPRSLKRHEPKKPVRSRSRRSGWFSREIELDYSPLHGGLKRTHDGTEGGIARRRDGGDGARAARRRELGHVRRPPRPAGGGAQPRLVVDFAEVDFVSSAGLRAVLTLVKRSRPQRRVRAVRRAGPVREVLDITGFTTMIDVHPELVLGARRDDVRADRRRSP